MVIAGALDVLLVSGTELAEEDELRAAGLEVARAASLVSATLRLRAGRPCLVLAGGDLCAGREDDVFAALREAGASAVVALYPPQFAWRAARALRAGADDSVALPADPGSVLARVRRLLDAGRTPAGRAAPTAPQPAPSVPTTARSDDSVASLVGDIAAINRRVGALDELLETIVTVFARRSTATRCSLLLVDEDGSQLRLAKSVGIPDPAASVPVPMGKGLAGRVAKTGMPLLVADIALLRGAAAAAQAAQAHGGYRTQSCLLLPLRATRGVLGVVCLADKESGVAFDETDLGRLGFLADQAALALENALAFQEVQELAAMDELTGLGNRRQFDAAIEREVQRARRYDRPLTLALFDVDHFKAYNDTLGHQAGDRALATIGEILRTSLREVDIVARYGGEEFAVILPETAARDGGGVSPFPFLERLRRRVEAAEFPGVERLHDGKLTISGGIACFPDDAGTVEELVAAADRALYASKARGRNTITYRDSPVIT